MSRSAATPNAIVQKEAEQTITHQRRRPAANKNACRERTYARITVEYQMKNERRSLV